MIRRHAKRGKHGILSDLVNDVQGDAHGEIKNGRPTGTYLPKDPDRRLRLLQALGLAEGTPEWPDEE